MDAALQVVGEARARAAEEEGGANARTAARVMQMRHKIQARLLAGRVLGISLSAVLASLYAMMLEGRVAAIIAPLLVAFLYGAAAEVLMTLTRAHGAFVALPMLRWLRPLEALMVPFAAPIAWLGVITDRLVPKRTDERESRIVELEVEHMIDQGEESGTITEDYAALWRRVLEFQDTIAREVMVPRTRMVAIDVETPINEVLKSIVEHGHSRYPVYKERVDQIVGTLYAKDLFQVMQQNEEHTVELAQIVRKPVFFVAESQKIGTLLREMQARRVHLAVVVDEFGGTSGIVTLEDIVEEIVGEIHDEHDEHEAPVQEVSPGRYLADARVSIYDFEDFVGTELPEDDGDYETLGGMIMEVAGRVPNPGDRVRVGPFEFIVREADARRITRVEVVRDDASPAE